MVTKVLIIVHYKQSLKTIVETNSSDYINNRVSTQLRENRSLHPIIFFSKNLNSIKYNYEIYNKKLLVII